MSKIYTRTGDQGKTSLRLGLRVDKDDIRIEVNGETDKLNAVLGIAKSMLSAEDEEKALVGRIQQQLMAMMAYVATSAQEDCDDATYQQMTEEMERHIDHWASMPSFHFDLPGKSTLNGILHLARTQCRTVERRLWTLNRTYVMKESIFCFLNRLSDYLFALALRG